MTKDNFEKLNEQVETLKKKRAKISKAIGEAREHGDLKENSAYHAAKEEQGLNEMRIRELEPANPASTNIIATILIAAGQIGPAIQGLEEMLGSRQPGIDPVREQIMPRVILSDAYRKLGQPAKAATYEAEAIKLKEKYNAGTK